MPYSNKSSSDANSADALSIISIKKFIAQLHFRLEKLSVILREEQEFLTSGNPDQISEIAQSKLSNFQELTKFISSYLNDHSSGMGVEIDNLESLIQRINQVCMNNRIEEWYKVKELIGACYNLSDENSIILANRLKYTNNAIDTLFSLAGATQNKTYDMKGLSQPMRISKQLASA